MSHKWDQRYRSGERIDRDPSPLLERFRSLLTAGRALDLACGAGRNALYLARLGWQVTAVDSSRVAIELLSGQAAASGIVVNTRVADLEKRDFLIETGGYDLICDFFYLQRDLFASIRAGIRPGGLFVATIHMIDDSPGLRPMRTEYLLKPGELAAEFHGWEILHDHEGKEGSRRRTAELVARKPR